MSESPQSNDGPQGTPETPAPLEYEAPRDRLQRKPPAYGFANFILFSAGFVISGGAIVWITAQLFLTHVGLERSAPKPATYVLAAIFFIAFLTTGFSVIRVAPKAGWHTTGRWFTLGLLIGSGLASLLEGCCFAAQ